MGRLTFAYSIMVDWKVHTQMTVFKSIDLRIQENSSRRAAALRSISRTAGEMYYKTAQNLNQRT